MIDSPAPAHFAQVRLLGVHTRANYVMTGRFNSARHYQTCWFAVTYSHHAHRRITSHFPSVRRSPACSACRPIERGLVLLRIRPPTRFPSGRCVMQFLPAPVHDECVCGLMNIQVRALLASGLKRRGSCYFESCAAYSSRSVELFPRLQGQADSM